MTDKTAAQGELLYNRLTKRYRHLLKWARRTGTNTFRLYDRDIPEIPLVLDLYGGAVSGAYFLKDDEDSENSEAWLQAMKAQIARALDIDEDRVFLKERYRMKRRQETGNQYTRTPGRSVYRDVAEGDLLYRVNLSNYLDAGLFLDARKKRALIRSAAGEKRVLNLFAYTCSLSVAAAKGAARQVDSVDLSNTYLEWGQINFALNGLESRCVEAEEFLRSPVHGENTLIRDDATRFIQRAAAKHLRWDLIILDPPSFSNSKKMRGTLDIRRDYLDLIRRCLSLLSPGGTLWFSSNARGFKPDNVDFLNYSIKDMGKELTDEDFMGKKIPLCYIFTAKDELS